MGRALRRGIASLLLVAVGLTAGSCAFFPGTLTKIVPPPDSVIVRVPPTILSCSASWILSRCEDEYETVCGYLCRYWDPCCDCDHGCDCGHGCWRWRYCCRQYWVRKHCWGDIAIKLTVADPSDDLNLEKNPRVRVFDAQPAPGSAASSPTCLLTVEQTDIPLSVTDITDNGETKIVTVRLRDIHLVFNSSCSRYAARLPLRIVFRDCGKEMASLNECVVSIEYSKP